MTTRPLNFGVLLLCLLLAYTPDLAEGGWNRYCLVTTENLITMKKSMWLSLMNPSAEDDTGRLEGKGEGEGKGEEDKGPDVQLDLHEGTVTVPVVRGDGEYFSRKRQHNMLWFKTLSGAIEQCPLGHHITIYGDNDVTEPLTVNSSRNGRGSQAKFEIRSLMRSTKTAKIVCMIKGEGIPNPVGTGYGPTHCLTLHYMSWVAVTALTIEVRNQGPFPVTALAAVVSNDITFRNLYIGTPAPHRHDHSSNNSSSSSSSGWFRAVGEGSSMGGTAPGPQRAWDENYPLVAFYGAFTPGQLWGESRNSIVRAFSLPASTKGKNPTGPRLSYGNEVQHCWFRVARRTYTTALYASFQVGLCLKDNFFQSRTIDASYAPIAGATLELVRGVHVGSSSFHNLTLVLRTPSVEGNHESLSFDFGGFASTFPAIDVRPTLIARFTTTGGSGSGSGPKVTLPPEEDGSCSEVFENINITGVGSCVSAINVASKMNCGLVKDCAIISSLPSAVARFSFSSVANTVILQNRGFFLAPPGSLPPGGAKAETFFWSSSDSSDSDSSDSSSSGSTDYWPLVHSPIPDSMAIQCDTTSYSVVSGDGTLKGTFPPHKPSGCSLDSDLTGKVFVPGAPTVIESGNWSRSTVLLLTALLAVCVGVLMIAVLILLLVSRRRSKEPSADQETKHLPQKRRRERWSSGRHHQSKHGDGNSKQRRYKSQDDEYRYLALEESLNHCDDPDGERYRVGRYGTVGGEAGVDIPVAVVESGTSQRGMALSLPEDERERMDSKRHHSHRHREREAKRQPERQILPEAEAEYDPHLPSTWASTAPGQSKRFVSVQPEGYQRRGRHGRERTERVAAQSIVARAGAGSEGATGGRSREARAIAIRGNPTYSSLSLSGRDLQQYHHAPVGAYLEDTQISSMTGTPVGSTAENTVNTPHQLDRLLGGSSGQQHTTTTLSGPPASFYSIHSSDYSSSQGEDNQHSRRRTPQATVVAPPSSSRAPPSADQATLTISLLSRHNNRQEAPPSTGGEPQPWPQWVADSL